MSDVVVFDEEVLSSMYECIKTFIAEYKQLISDSINGINGNSDQWNDEDFNSLLSAMDYLLKESNNIEETSNKILEIINNKIEAIHILHNMKI